MALLSSSNGGDDRLQVGVIVFCTVISLLITMMVPMIAPDYADSDTGYSYADIYSEKSSLEQFTGESMINQTPWKLTHVYTPWSRADGVQGHVEKDTGWFYGQDIDYRQEGYMGTTVIGDTKQIYLNSEKKSDTPLDQIEDKVKYKVEEKKWWAYGLNGELNLFGHVFEWTGNEGYTTKTVTKTADVNSWSYTGYRYSFDPMLKIDYENYDPSKPYEKESQTDATLSIVWYQNSYGTGLSNGLILYNEKTHGFVTNLEKETILQNYNLDSSYSSKYELDYDGVKININIRFDQDVIATGMDLSEAFDQGRWSLAVTAKSLDNFMDIKNSNSFSVSAGNLVDTYSKIMVFDMPNVPLVWEIVLWVLCVLPLVMAVMLFFTRSLITAGVGAGILGSILAIGLM